MKLISNVLENVTPINRDQDLGALMVEAHRLGNLKIGDGFNRMGVCLRVTDRALGNDYISISEERQSSVEENLKVVIQRAYVLIEMYKSTY